MDVKKELIKTSNTVRKKYLALKRGIVDEEEIFKKKFKPIVDPISEIVKNIEEKKKKKSDKNSSILDSEQTPSSSLKVMNESKPSQIQTNESLSEESDSNSEHDENEENFNDYINKSINDSKNEMDHTYGVYLGDNDEWMIGNSKINYDPSDSFIKIKGQKFKPTIGLLELMFKKKPNKTLITKDDLNSFKDILLLTNAHLVRHSDGEKVQATNTFKYRNYIKNIFKKGSGLKTPYLKLDTYPCAPDYVHYDNINEIVDRLRLLKLSEISGNTSHNNEVINIISELRDKGVIE